MEFRVRQSTSTLLIVTLLTSALLAPFQSASAATPGEDLKQIEYKYYFRGKYQQAIESLQVFLARLDLTEADATRAREVLAASYVLGGAPAMGKQLFADMIAKNPAYPGPDPNVFKLEVVDAYAQARSEYTALTLAPSTRAAQDRDKKGAAALPADAAASTGTPIYKKWWFYAGAAALIAGIGVAVGGGGDDGGSPPASGTVTVGVIVE